MRESLIKARLDKDLNVKQAAKIFNISESFYYKLESGIRNPNFKLMEKMAEFYGKDVGILFFDNEMDEMSIKEN